MLLFTIATLPTVLLHGDLVVIDQKTDSFANVGQFNAVFGNDPTSSPGQIVEILNMGNSNTLDSQSGSIQAGVLWTLFDSQMINSLNRMVLCFGVNESGTVGTNWVDIASLRLRIQDPNNLNNNLTDIDLDTPNDNTIRVFNYAQGANTAEAEFTINLGYDFMTVFNGSSTELINLDATVTNRSAGFEIFFFDAAANAIPEPAATPLLLLLGVSTFIRRRLRTLPS